MIALGNNDEIHLAATDLNNIIRYHLHEKKQWKSNLVTEIHPLVEINNLTLTVDSKGRGHLIYCLRSGRKNGEWQLTHSYSATDRQHSIVIDSGIGLGEVRSWAAIDENDNLHVIYSVPGLNTSGLKHQAFNANQQEWTPMEPIPLLHHENREPCAVFDKASNLHLVWISSDGRNFRTVYSQRKNKPWPEGGWTDPTPLSDQGSNAYSPYLLITGETVTALWQQLNGVFYKVSENLSQSWEPVKKQTAIQNLDQYALKYLFPGPNHYDLSTLKAYSSSGPQVALSTAASLLHPPANGRPLEKKLPVASPVAPSHRGASVDIFKENLSEDGKRFLLEYSDTLLTNRLINQTVDSQEQQLTQLGSEIKTLQDHLKEQERQLNSFKSLSELYRKEAETLKQQLLSMEDKETQAQTKLAESIERNTRTEEILEEVRKANILLEADSHKTKRQLAIYESSIQDQPEWSEKDTREKQQKSQQPPQQLRYKMISTKDFEEDFE